MKYIDVHAHLSERIFDKHRKSILNACAEKEIVVINCTGKPDDNRKALKLAKEYKNFKLCLGVYPLEAQEMNDKDFFAELKFIENNKDNIIGIGEVGIDYYWEKNEYKRQKQVARFTEIIWLANKLKLPLNVHTRDVEKGAIALLLQLAKVPVLLHSYGGDLETAQPAIKAGYYFSVAPIIVRSNKHKALFKELPLSSIVSETDCPYLGPTTERNDPTNVPLVINEIAKIKGLNEEEVRIQMLSNAKALFNL